MVKYQKFRFSKKFPKNLIFLAWLSRLDFSGVLSSRLTDHEQNGQIFDLVDQYFSIFSIFFYAKLAFNHLHVALFTGIQFTLIRQQSLELDSRKPLKIYQIRLIIGLITLYTFGLAVFFDYINDHLEDYSTRVGFINFKTDSYDLHQNILQPIDYVYWYCLSVFFVELTFYLFKAYFVVRQKFYYRKVSNKRPGRTLNKTSF